jgi:hypothetical protein
MKIRNQFMIDGGDRYENILFFSNCIRREKVKEITMGGRPKS